ncbi:MAG: peptidyl-prolyl cis-trans isomerase, EpsD family, partial [Methylobacterium sp.]|nr:peptidyl-prolyl cis-trans isomerase, EpsD family [Methylobacterium sp.]
MVNQNGACEAPFFHFSVFPGKQNRNKRLIPLGYAHSTFILESSSMRKTDLLQLRLAPLLIALVLSACGGDGGDSKSATQALVRINGEEITVHQLNYQMSRVGELSEEQGKKAARQVLRRLVDQELLVHQAVEEKLDRDAAVLQNLEAAKREILAQAYMEKQFAAIKKPSQQEMDAFYAQHPELFEKRRIYRLQELVVAVGKEKALEIEAIVRAAGGFEAIAESIKDKGYQFSANASVRAAEQLPMELLPRLQQMKAGEVVIVPTERSVNILMLAASQDQPVTREKATPLIEQYFVNRSKGDISKQTLEKLRAEAKVEFLGDYADMK